MKKILVLLICIIIVILVIDVRYFNSAYIPFVGKTISSIRQTLASLETSKKLTTLTDSTSTNEQSTSSTSITVSSSTDASSTEITTSDADLLKKIDQLFIIGFRGYTFATAPELKKAVTETNLGGVLLFDYDSPTKKYVRNIQSSSQLTTLISDIQKNAKANDHTPLFISVDEEGGKVSRLKSIPGYTITPSAEDLGSKTTDDVKAVATGLGKNLVKFGFNIDFAPDMDVNVNPQNPVIAAYGRSFSDDPTTVSKKGIAFAQGLLEQAIIPVIKHFPGHGSSNADSHVGFVDISNTYKEYEAVPFKNACIANVPAVMVGHLFNKNVDPTYPATLSSIFINNLKTVDECDSQLVLSDDLDMAAITNQYGKQEALKLAINAGIDVIILSNNIFSYDPNEYFTARQTVLKLVKDGSIPESRINEAYAKITALKEQFKITL